MRYLLVWIQLISFWLFCHFSPLQRILFMYLFCWAQEIVSGNEIWLMMELNWRRDTIVTDDELETPNSLMLRWWFEQREMLISMNSFAWDWKTEGKNVHFKCWVFNKFFSYCRASELFQKNVKGSKIRTQYCGFTDER